MAAATKEEKLLEKLNKCRQKHKVKAKDQADELRWIIRHAEYHLNRLQDVSEELKIVFYLDKMDPAKYGTLKANLTDEKIHHLYCLSQIIDFKDIAKVAPDYITPEEAEKVERYHLHRTKKEDLKAIYGKDGSVISKETTETLQKAIRYKYGIF